MEIKIRNRIHQGQENPIKIKKIIPRSRKNIMIKKNSSKPREPHKGTILRTQVTTKNKYCYRTVHRKYTADKNKKKLDSNKLP
jgi:hypothetical protein